MTKFLAFVELLNVGVPSTELFFSFSVFYTSSRPTHIFVNTFPCKHFIKCNGKKILNYVKIHSSYFIIMRAL